MTSGEQYMHRCLQLAQLGAGSVAPNPMVGAVLVYENRIIGEGYHQKYGEAHAEPNCIASVKEEDRHLIQQSTLFVSLEPCAHFGKTPPCADLIIEKKIPRVVVGCRDPFFEVNGKGIEKLKAAGIEVESGVLEEECRELNKRFFTFHTLHRPYVILKWAQTLDGKISPHLTSPNGGTHAQSSLMQDANNNYSSISEVGELLSPVEGVGGGRLLISNEHTNRLVHKWRAEEMSIAVGTNTALFDDPELTTRLWPGKNPVRIVVDMDLRLPKSLKLFNSKTPTIVFNTKEHNLPREKISLKELEEVGVGYYQVTEDVSLVHQMMNALYRMNIQSILVEGGSYLLQSFIDEAVWDEARIITNEQLLICAGLPAPILKGRILQSSEHLFSDVIRTYKNTNYNS
ncbi:MAG: bifunctional diaminohydroxyphosphoribosylaminopyrimidine deaminase/5-amino-6-(5-phosphoribosylamino)uracil reductase RibD [Flavisolibacter sp.]|nr:bifunctional diaminohydroxyphosphoribosylaminopyrimidine deaminase/5-amino-6-(5-phosphoribosylamino)uracil reductase RibD [Flavisolibacter sp.]